MSPKENSDLKIYLSHLSAYFQRPLSDVVLKMYADDLNDLQFDLVMQGLHRYRVDPKNRTMPLPAQIRAICMPVSDPHDVGVLTAAKIVQSVAKFGWSNPEGASEFIGPLGMAAVRAFGGWNYVCENLGVTLDVTTFQAQVREICKSESRMNQIGATHLSLEANHSESKQIAPKTLELLNTFKPKEF